MTQLRSTLPQQPQHILDEIGMWSVVVPEAGTNLVTNPSFENDTTGWAVTGTGASIARSTAYSAFGAASLLFSDASASGAENAYTSNIAVSASTVYTWSFYWRKTSAAGQAGTYRVDYYTAGSVLISSETRTFPVGNIGDWQRASVTFTTPATTASVVLVYIAPSSGAYSLYIDGVQLEARPYPTTYIDGDQEGCYWGGIPHASSSSRSATARQGGRIVPFKKYNWRTTALVGLQVAALNTISTPYALIGGGYYQRSVAPPRAFSIVGGFDCQSQIDLARARNEMAQALVPFATAPDTPVRLVYEPLLCNDGAASSQKTLIDAVYTGGLEGNQTNDVGIERHALGFRVHLPFAALGIRELDTSTALAFYSTTTNDTVFRRNVATGEISAVTGFADFANDAVLGNEGIYVTGTSLSSPDVRVGLWDGLTASALGGGGLTGASGTGNAIVRDIDNSIVFGGSFNDAGGVAASNVARFTPGSGWSAMGASALNNTVRSLAVQGGIVWAGGSFTTPNTGLAGFDGIGWSGVSGLNDVVRKVLARPGTNDLFVGGDFTTPNTRFAVYRIGTGWVASGAGVDNIIYDMAIGPDGLLYACGSFIYDVSSTIALYRVARWTGTTWAPLGNGLAGTCEHIEFDSNGILYASAAYRTPTGASAGNYLSAWNGSEWYSPGFQPSSIPSGVRAIVPLGGYDYFFGAMSGFANAGRTTVNNAGAVVNPVFVLTGTGLPTSIVNETTGAAIRLNYDIADGETVTITTGAQPSVISSIVGNVAQYLLPSSQLSSFTLAPGGNVIAVFITGSNSNTTATIVYKETITSLDQAVR